MSCHNVKLYLSCSFFLSSCRAHAALSPWEGRNALDAAVLGYNNISALRQQLPPTHRVHGIFEGRDWAPNSLYWSEVLFVNFLTVSWGVFVFLLSHPGLCTDDVSLLFQNLEIRILYPCTLRSYVRAPTLAELEVTLKRVIPCFE
jgi:hypothetical protein